MNRTAGSELTSMSPGARRFTTSPRSGSEDVCRSDFATRLRMARDLAGYSRPGPWEPHLVLHQQLSRGHLRTAQRHVGAGWLSTRGRRYGCVIAGRWRVDSLGSLVELVSVLRR